MTKKNPSNIFAIISAIAFTVILLGSVYNFANSLYTIGLSHYLRNYLKIFLLDVLEYVMYIPFIVLLFLRKKNIGLPICININILYCLYYVIVNFSIRNLLNLLAFICLLIIAIFICIPELNAIAGFIKYVWFIPTIFLVVSRLIYYVPIIVKDFNFTIVLSYFVYIISYTIPYFFLSLWLRSALSVKPTGNVETSDYSSFAPNPINQSALGDVVLGGADNLLMYKELLDAGTITQEEFDIKKKQILEL